jgi:hypothetical protein
MPKSLLFACFAIASSDRKKLGNAQANLLINRGAMATLQEYHLGYHPQAGLEPGTSRYSTLHISHYATRGIEYTRSLNQT